ncbi:MAG: sigma-70 family RNA polymerase sigma factor [Phycisphaerales bacterium]|nr:sigma-70 family RNA polymerase sigma factor [Phycisphaerae bacterium]NNF43815.1 sigma-70 family RNA polymerase sigma factor [Phycisphaerales bacterium]NNM27199.1 sigma-70 family RNA polymerase sigma factor [Phycisphaerales bacterium]
MPIALGERAHRRGRGGADATPNPPEIDQAWIDYRQNGCTVARNRLVTHYMAHHVRPIASRLHAGLPQQVELDDLLQQGYLGLIDAMDRYDLDRETRFETFSRRRIFGAIQDYLRSIDPIPRLTRARSKQVHAAGERFRKQFGRPPSEEELRPLLGVSGPTLARFLADQHPRAMVTFSGAHPDGANADSDADAMDVFEDHLDPGPAGLAEKHDLQRWVTRGFDLRDRLIIVLYYYEQLTMSEIGRVIGISESRVSQRLESILACLRSRLLSIGAEAEFVFT